MKPSILSSTQKIPIYIIGAGGIVNTAHLPAYKIAGFNVQGIYDIDHEKAIATAANFNIPHVFKSIAHMVGHAPSNAVFDIAVPGSAVVNLLQQLPDNCTVLMQKPMGENYEAAMQILAISQQKNMLAGINFQLRYAPYILAAKDLINKGLLGDINDIEVNVNVYTPWHLWDFLLASPRVEILYHSIHYIDLVRNLLGNPLSVYAKSTRHSSMPKMAAVKSNIIMDYGDIVRASISTNHCHNYGTHKQHSYIKIEGSKGAIIINFGALINYPQGAADSFEYVLLQPDQAPEWQQLKIEGSWFPHAFIGSMHQILLAAEGAQVIPDNNLEDCIATMACVEAAYLSSKQGGVPLKDII